VALVLGREVDDDDVREPRILGHVREELAQGREAAGRGSDPDHDRLRPLFVLRLAQDVALVVEGALGHDAGADGVERRESAARHSLESG